MVTHFVLQIPNIVIIPSIEDLQNYFGKVITSIIEMHKNVVMWGQRYLTDKALLGNKNIEYDIRKESERNALINKIASFSLINE